MLSVCLCLPARSDVLAAVVLTSSCAIERLITELLEDTLLTLEQITTGMTVLAPNAARRPEESEVGSYGVGRGFGILLWLYYYLLLICVSASGNIN